MQDKTRFHLMNIMLAIVVVSTVITDKRTAVQLMALIGATWLAMLLIVPRLLYSPFLARWHGEFLRIAKLSKNVGLWVAAWFAAHGATAALTYYGFPSSPAALFGDFILTQPIVLALASITILLLLALISNKWSYAHLKWWKHLNMLVWALPLMALAHSILAASKFRDELPFLLIAPLLFALSAIAGYAVLFTKQKKRMDYLRLLWLTLGGVAALLVIFAWPR